MHAVKSELGAEKALHAVQAEALPPEKVFPEHAVHSEVSALKKAPAVQVELFVLFVLLAS